MSIVRTTNKIARREGRNAARLRVIYGPDAGLEIALPLVGVVVGADKTADVVLSDPAVSGRHASIKPTSNGFEVTDVNSKNGTYCDNVAITRASVPNGAILRVGSSLLQLVPDEESIDIPPSKAFSFGRLHGKSLTMRKVFGLLERASESNASILLVGESGTGKELAARAVHEHSSRRNEPFVIFDCGAASEHLIESDLFGHVRGAFTGADHDRPGAFELAHGGTLLLDEIGELPLALQPKLLRLLEAGEAMPLGGKKVERFDVRIVAATHKDLAAEVARGTFRGDLYYRLAVVEAHIPPLRHRLDDLEDIVLSFLRREGVDETDLASDNLERLRAYAFPGNVRELRNVIARAIALAPKGARFAEMPILLSRTEAAQEGFVVRADVPYHDAKNDVLNRFERVYLEDLLARSANNISQAARIAQVGRKLLYSMLNRTGLTQGIRPPANDDES